MHCICPGSQKRVSGHWDPELQAVMRCQVGAGAKPGSSARVVSTLNF